MSGTEVATSSRLGLFSNTRLFPSVFDSEIKPKKKTLTNLGGSGDCGFRAMAAAIVENIRSNYHRNEGLYHKLLQRHLEIFSHKYGSIFPTNPKAEDRYIAHVHRLEQMCTKPGFISDLAFTLRQVAVDEMKANPKNYPIIQAQGNLSAEDKETSLEIMSKQHTYIDEMAIAAVANALSVPVVVRVTESNKELFASRHYGPKENTSKQADAIEIRLQGRHYQAMLAEPTYFADVINQPICTPPENFKPNLPSAKEQIAASLAVDKKIASDFNKNFAYLDEKIKAGQLDKAKLIDIYIHGLSKFDNSGYLSGRIRQVGIEYGNQDFFKRALDNTNAATSLTRSDASDPFEVIIRDELHHAIDQAMTMETLTAKDKLEGENVAFSDEVKAMVEGVDRPSVSTSIHRG